MRSRQYDAAMSEFEAAKAIDPKNSTVKLNISECHNNKGVALYRQRNYPDAIVEFEHCLEVNPGHPQARQNINLCRQRMNIEGIPDAPSGAEDKGGPANEGPPGGDKKKGKESAGAAKEDSSPKVSGGSAPELTVSAGGAKLYSTGGLYPQYSDTPTAVNARTVQFAPPAGSKVTTAAPGGTGATSLSATSSTGGTGRSTSVGSARQSSAAATASGGSANADASSVSKANPAPFVGDAFEPGSTPYTPGNPNVPNPPQASTESAAAKASTEGAAAKASTEGAAAKASDGPTIPKQSAAAESVNNAAPQSTSLGANAVNNTNATLPTATNYTPTADGLTLDEKVGALEIKVYGKKNPSLPIMKRIEQLETDYVGQVRPGSMNERVEYLKRAIGHGQ